MSVINFHDIVWNTVAFCKSTPFSYQYNPLSALQQSLNYFCSRETLKRILTIEYVGIFDQVVDTPFMRMELK
jgi:hypothetical protein